MRVEEARELLTRWREKNVDMSAIYATIAQAASRGEILVELEGLDTHQANILLDQGFHLYGDNVIKWVHQMEVIPGECIRRKPADRWEKLLARRSTGTD